MNLKARKIEEFGEFSQFESLKEFNHHIEQWMLEHKAAFSKGELVALKRLVRYSAKIPGVCNAKIGTLLKAIHEEYNGNGISRSTFKRMTLKAKELGIITVYETGRKNGSQTANLYVFNRFPADEPPKAKKMNHHETSNPSKTNNQEIKKRNEEPLTLDHTFTNDRVPQLFVQLVKYFFNDPKTIEEYWKMVNIAAYKNTCEEDQDQVLEVGILAFKQLIRKIKSMKIRNPFGYFYGILDRKFMGIFMEELDQLIECFFLHKIIRKRFQLLN
jgi:N-acetylglutamate synthase-like GNAT family acetyltransferase